MPKEKRRPRESFTRSLKKIAARIDETQEYQIEWHDHFFRKKEKTLFRVKTLWVFGSWAKGALDCGDLDLVADISIIEGTMPMTSTLRKALIKGARDVRLYIGNPKQNTSGAPLDDAVLIWSISNRDWKGNIANISPNPFAKRFERKVDILPLRTEQLYDEIDVLEKLVDLKNQGVLDWLWIPISDVVSKAINWSETANSFFERLKHVSGKKTIEAMQLVINWFEINDPVQTCTFDHDSRAAFIINGKKIHVGRPPVHYRTLEHHSRSELMIVPHFSKRGPNGIWFIRRGLNHPVEQLFQNVSVYYLKREDSSPDIVEAISDWRSINEIDLFRDQQDAESLAQELADNMEVENQVGMASGAKLLSIISRADQILIDGEPYAVTIEGTLFDGEEYELPNPDDLKEIFSQKTT